MTLARSPATPDGSRGDASLASQLRLSIARILNATLPAQIRGMDAGLRQLRLALNADTLDDALRTMDRTWRSYSYHAVTLAPIYGRLLMLEARDHEAALGLLHTGIGFGPDPELAALVALALLRLQRVEDARRQIDTALADYCVLPDSLLSHVAGEVMGHESIGAPGWIGRGPRLELVGELAAEETANVLEITLDGNAAFTQLLRNTARAGRRPFSFSAPQLNVTSRLKVSARGIPLLGAELRIPPDFALDGRVLSSGRRLTGWARLGWLPASPLRLQAEDEHRHRREFKTGRRPQSSWRWPFSIDLAALGLSGSRINILAQLPDGGWQALPDSPLLLTPALRLAGHKPVRLPRWSAGTRRARTARAQSQNERLTDVIIPVYRGHEETVACIEAVLATVDRTARVVVVDDATDETALASALDALAAAGRITLLRNPENLGFVASVNRAIALNPTHDVVLLNSDTVVFDDWLARLRAAAYSGPAVGTVTPLSNSGSIASYPRTLGAAIDPEDGAVLHALAASTHSGARVEIPVGVGFCLYIRRDCLREVGTLDATVFGKGYGEETDFCLRARSRGWSHQLAADVFVYHAGGLSFGGRREALWARSQRLVNLRHPGYDRFIASFLKQDPLHALRRQLDERRLLAFDGKFVLLVTLALTGGVDRFVNDRCRSLRAQGLFPLLLRPAAAGDSGRCELWTDAMELPNLQYQIPSQLPEVMALLGQLALEAIEIQHFLHLDTRLIEAVRALDVPYDVVVHDYAWICPRITLIDGTGRHCGEPAVTVCQTCVRRNGSKLDEPISVPALRSRSERWLRGARRVTAPSADTATRLQRYFEGLAVEVKPHTASLTSTTETERPAKNRKDKVRVALIGAIGEHKGHRVLLECARDARDRGLPLEFVVIGYTQHDAPLIKTGKVFVTGRYVEPEVQHLLRRERPDIAWLPSVWPETWCYTLDHALEAGLPVAAFDLGAIADRLRSMDNGLLLPLGLEPRRINDGLMRLARGQAPARSNEPRSVQTALSSNRHNANMAQSKHDEISMSKPANGKPAQEVEEAGLSASVQVLPLPAGLYLFSVKAAGPVSARSAGGQLSLPAVHVGLGPGVRSDQVEFIAGPSTHGAWLFSQGDLLVTKVNGAGATLIMTSMRAPGGEVLSIKVERLEARAEAAPPQPARPGVAPAAAQASKAAPGPAKETAKPPAAANQPLPVQIGAHIRTRGDMSFANVPWAGRVAPGLWIESFSVRPLEQFAAKDLEYKGLTGSGFETPWLSDEKMCGTKGMAVPLVGFAVRLKASAATAGYDCEYSGYFQSGVTVGPLRNGSPCRSTVANDPLEGLQIRLVKRAGATTLAPRNAKSAAAARPARVAPKPAPGAHKANGASQAAVATKSKAGKRAPAHVTASRITPSIRKHATRRP